MDSETRHSFCRICEASCGLEFTVTGNKIDSIRPNADHVGTNGFACMKGLNQHKMYDSPDRLQTPLKRVGSDFVPISWKQANHEIGAKVKQLKSISPHAISMYVGTAAGFSILHPIFANGFMRGIGSRNIYSSATQDCANRFASAQELYGFPFLQPYPDLHKINHLLIVGTNPVVSKWTFLQVTHPAQTLKAISQRGGKVVVVDPRRTETAKISDQHVFIRPTADVFFFLSFLNEIICTGGVDNALVDEHMSGYAELKSLIEEWPAERTEDVTGIAPPVLRKMVSDFVSADGAGIVTGTGLGMGGHGTLAHWLAECINAVTGNLDREGGMLIGEGIFDMAAHAKKTGEFDRTRTSRIGGYRELNGGLPGAILADEILTPGQEQIRALFVTGGNPLLTMANSARLAEALKALELLVVVDIYLNETASLANYVLPATSPLERADLPFVFPLFLGLQSRPYISATDKVVDATGQQRDEATIYTDLAKASGAPLFGTRAGQFVLNRMTDLNSLFRGKKQRSVPVKFILNQILARTKQPSFKKLLNTPNGIEKPKPKTGNFLSRKVTTDDGKVHLSTPNLLTEAAKLNDAFENILNNQNKFRLISKRAHFTHNSWTQNISELTTGKARQTNYAYLHPDDAAALNLQDGDCVDIASETATIRLPMKTLGDLSRKTISVPHGWGHQHAKGLSVASKIGGANVNLLASDKVENIERISGMAHLTGVLVDVSKSLEPVSTAHWSGIQKTAES